MSLHKVHRDIDEETLELLRATPEQEGHRDPPTNRYAPGTEDDLLDSHARRVPLPQKCEGICVTAFHRAAERMLDELPPFWGCVQEPRFRSLD